MGSNSAKKISEEKGASEDVLSDVKGPGTVDMFVCEIPEANSMQAPKGVSVGRVNIKVVGRNIVLETAPCIFLSIKPSKHFLKPLTMTCFIFMLITVFKNGLPLWRCQAGRAHSDTVTRNSALGV